jgi:tripartite-type tricarboxylate transporter receptor subunit TctC
VLRLRTKRLCEPGQTQLRPGAGSVIGTAAGAKSPSDGYTLVMAGSGSLAISATMYKKLPYDPVKDFAPIGLIARIPFVLVVNPSLPVHSIAELVQYAREHPGGLSYGSGGPGSPHHLQAEMLPSTTGIEMMHVPYKGSAPALTDVLAGHVPLMFSDVVPALPQIREGKVRVLGVSTSVRLPSAPDIPTLAEAGVPGFDAAGWGVISRCRRARRMRSLRGCAQRSTAFCRCPRSRGRSSPSASFPPAHRRPGRPPASSTPRSSAGGRSSGRRGLRERSRAAHCTAP